MVEVGIRALFTNFCYTFGGEIYQQQAGCPIGARITMAASRLRMQDWGENYSMIFWRSYIYTYLKPKNYVDDVRQATEEIERGNRLIKARIPLSIKMSGRWRMI